MKLKTSRARTRYANLTESCKIEINAHMAVIRKWCCRLSRVTMIFPVLVSVSSFTYFQNHARPILALALFTEERYFANGSFANFLSFESIWLKQRHSFLSNCNSQSLFLCVYYVLEMFKKFLAGHTCVPVSHIYRYI